MALCDQLESLLSVRDKEEVATTLINIMQKLDKAKDFLTEVVIAEVRCLGKVNFEDVEGFYNFAQFVNYQTHLWCRFDFSVVKMSQPSNFSKYCP